LDQVRNLPGGLRGIYVLYKRRKNRRSGFVHHNVVYVGMANKGGIRARLRWHRRSKKDLWTHFSVFEVWENIRDEEILELEGLFRHIYRDDSKANKLNAARGFNPLRLIRKSTIKVWSRVIKGKRLR
jgi:hypothetical protein